MQRNSLWVGHNSGQGLWADIYDDTIVDQYQYNKLQAAILYSLILYIQTDFYIVPQIDPSVKLYNHGEGPYKGLLLIESGYNRFHIYDTITITLLHTHPLEFL